MYETNLDTCIFLRKNTNAEIRQSAFNSRTFCIFRADDVKYCAAIKESKSCDSDKRCDWLGRKGSTKSTFKLQKKEDEDKKEEQVGKSCNSIRTKASCLRIFSCVWQQDYTPRGCMDQGDFDMIRTDPKLARERKFDSAQRKAKLVEVNKFPEKKPEPKVLIFQNALRKKFFKNCILLDS